MIERNLRLRKERELRSVQRDFHGRLSSQWLWAQIVKTALAGQGWFVIGLAGEATTISSSTLPMDYCRRLYWYQCCCHINRHCMVIRYKDGVLS